MGYLQKDVPSKAIDVPREQLFPGNQSMISVIAAWTTTPAPTPTTVPNVKYV